MATGGTIQPGRDIRARLESMTDRLAAVLPRHITPQRMVQVVSAMVYRNPELQKCDPNSILAATMQAAELGLDLSPTTGEAYLIPRWNGKAQVSECTFQPGYRGLIKLVRQSGDVLDIDADTVKDGDEFEYGRAPMPYLVHRPGKVRGAVLQVYAIAYLPGGLLKYSVLTRDEVEAIRRRSKAADRGPWQTDWEEMAKVRPLRRLCKLLPMTMTPAMARAVEADNEWFDLSSQQTALEPPQRGRQAQADRLARMLEQEPQDVPAGSDDHETFEGEEQ